MKIRKYLLPVAIIILTMLTVEAMLLIPPFSSDPAPETSIGLILTDSEDDWKQEMYRSIEQAARQHNIQVTTIHATRTQSDQIDAIRTLLVYNTSAIIFSPVMENGWENILQEAANANIPLITINEQLSSKNFDTDSELKPAVYHIGFDYHTLAASLSRTMMEINSKDFELIQLSGTVASAVGNEISEGFREVMDEHARYRVSFSVSADYMLSRAYNLLDSLLRNGYQFNAVFSYNDGMTLGAIAALEEHGLQPGNDVRIFAIGGGATVINAFNEGKINALGYCDLSDFGDTVINTVLMLQNGDRPDEITLLPSSLMVNGGTAS